MNTIIHSLCLKNMEFCGSHYIQKICLDTNMEFWGSHFIPNDTPVAHFFTRVSYIYLTRGSCKKMYSGRFAPMKPGHLSVKLGGI